MVAVDHFDHYCCSYAFTWKSPKWWWKTFFWLLEVAVVNSFILYNERHYDEPLDHICYRKQLILQLVGEQHASQPRQCRGRPYYCHYYYYLYYFRSFLSICFTGIKQMLKRVVCCATDKQSAEQCEDTASLHTTSVDLAAACDDAEPCCRESNHSHRCQLQTDEFSKVLYPDLWQCAR